MMFRTTVQLEGRTATGLLVPADVVTRLDSGRRPAVSVTVNGHTYRSTIASRGGRYLIPVSADIRRITGLAAGDEVGVEVELDTAPREVVVPADLAQLLDAEPEVRRFFDGLAYSHQLAQVLPIEQARTAETRQRRLDKAMDVLREGRAR